MCLPILNNLNEVYRLPLLIWHFRKVKGEHLEGRRELSLEHQKQFKHVITPVT